MAKLHVSRVGLEVEGSWESNSMAHRLAREENANAVVHDDGSVDDLGGWGGEIVCYTPLVPEKDEVDVWTNGIWPREWNRSCGLHVHLSFLSDRAYAAVARMDFYDKFIPWAKETATALGVLDDVFKERLLGHNYYCQPLKDKDIDDQIMQRARAPARYRHLNFCKGIHGTVENRLFPMLAREKAVDLVSAYMDMVDAYCEENIDKITKISRRYEPSGIIKLEPKILAQGVATITAERKIICV